MNYEEFIYNKTHLSGEFGFEPVWMPNLLFPFQVSLVEWACKKGRAAIFADCGMGKTLIQLTWAENVVRKTDGNVLVLTPLAVCFQTVYEGKKIGLSINHSKNGEANRGITVTNYESLHKFKSTDFVAVVCDESSILKNFDGVYRSEITSFMRKLPYRLLCTATAAPNDFVELGTSSEAIGNLGATDVISKFFRKSKATCTRRQEHMSGIYEIRPHAKETFWRWVSSWSRSVRLPSDMGFRDDGYVLPGLIVNNHVVKSSKPRDGYLFDVPAVGLAEQRSDLRNTLKERCTVASDLINAHDNPAIAWCNLNTEGDLLTKMIDGACQVSGKDDDEKKEQVFKDFISGKVRVLVTKPSIGAFGLNLQHCAHQTFFPSHSYEQWYQCIRRCWRFGQKKRVTVDMVTTEGQERVLSNLMRKSEQADRMFSELVKVMYESINVSKKQYGTKKEELPSWL